MQTTTDNSKKTHRTRNWMCVQKPKKEDEKKVLLVSCVINIEEVVKHWAKTTQEKRNQSLTCTAWIKTLKGDEKRANTKHKKKNKKKSREEYVNDTIETNIILNNLTAG